MDATIQLDRPSRVYTGGETVKGSIIIVSSTSTSHAGITLSADGCVALQLSPKGGGLFDAIYNVARPLTLLQSTMTLSEPGRLVQGRNEFPFQFVLKPTDSSIGLFETYHGVFINVQYAITVEVQRGLFTKSQKETLPFVVQVPGQVPATPLNDQPTSFTLEPQYHHPSQRQEVMALPTYCITGQVDALICDITKPFTGSIVIQRCDLSIVSIDLQLARIEFCATIEGVAKEATEVLSIQVADGDVCRGLTIPLYMVFPRWFTCPTLIASSFKVEFEITLLIRLEGIAQPLREQFPIKIHRPATSVSHRS